MTDAKTWHGAQKAWKGMPPNKRVAVLRSLGVEKNRLASHIPIGNTGFVSDLSRLPIPFMTLLLHSFADGGFSQKAYDRHEALLNRLARDIKLGDDAPGMY